MRPAAVACLLAAALALGGLLRWSAIAQKPGLTHDEGISYLVATGHLGEFSLIVPGDGSPAARWADAAEWRRYMTCDGLGGFRLIAQDLARYDVHPPLYFWMLHAWMAAAGTGVRAGNALNATLALLTVAVLFAVAAWVLRDAVAAAFVALLWAVSPHAIAEPLEARAYGLLALLTLLFVAALSATLERGRAAPLPALGLALATAAGALTHYGFALAVAGGALFAAVVTLRRAPRAPGPLVAVAVALSAGLALAALAHPGFELSFERQREAAAGFSAADVPRRIAGLFHALGGRWAPGQPDAPVAAGVVLTLVAGAAALRWPAVRARLAPRERAVAFLLAWLAGATFLLYLAQVVPAHAMGARYTSAVWILFAFVPVWLARALPPRAATPALAALALAAAAASGAYLRSGAARAGLPSQGELLAGADRIVIDSIARGVLPRVIPDLPAGARVFAAPQRLMLAEPGALGAEASGAIRYVSSGEYGNSAGGRAAVAARLGAAQGLTWTPGGLPGLDYARIPPAGARAAGP